MAEVTDHPSLLCNPGMGFHGLKDLLVTTKYLREHCEFLTSNIEVITEVTRAAATPFRRSSKGLPYLGLDDRMREVNVTKPEDQYERAMFKKWFSEDGSLHTG